MKNIAREKLLTKMLEVIRKKPGIRPSEINRIVGKPHTASLRTTLIKRGLIRKEKDGPAMRYYPL